MEAKAHLKYLRISPRKVKIVIDLIRGKNADEALAILMYTPKAAAPAAAPAAEWQALEEFLYDYGAASVLGHYSDVSATAVGVEGFNYFNFPIYWNVKVPA